MNQDTAFVDQQRKARTFPVCPTCGYHANSEDPTLTAEHNGLGECPLCDIIVTIYLKVKKELKPYISSVILQN